MFHVWGVNVQDAVARRGALLLYNFLISMTLKPQMAVMVRPFSNCQEENILQSQIWKIKGDTIFGYKLRHL